jgi:hypothetical protein
LLLPSASLGWWLVGRGGGVEEDPNGAEEERHFAVAEVGRPDAREVDRDSTVLHWW